MKIQTIPLFAAAILAVSILATPAAPQSASTESGPRPIRPPHTSITGSTEVDARLDGVILQVRCEQTFVNHGHRLEEVEILLPVPADAVVTDGLLIADGREYRAEVLPADEARQIYEKIVRSRRDPALLELVGHGLIRLSAFPIPPGEERTVSFRYHQQLPTDLGRTRLLLPIAALCGIDRVGTLELHLSIDGNDPIAQVYSPSHDLRIERRGPNEADLYYAADPPDLRETLEVITVRDTRSVGIDLRTADGHGESDYFLLAVSPGWDLLRDRHDTAETIVFVLDRSGSMEGEKFEQARAALREFLDDCSDEDRFNLIAFSDEIDPLFAGGPRRADRDAKREARRWLDQLRAGGGTAIAEAIDEATRTRWEADLVLFLTDGLPTVGETDPKSIVRQVAQAASRLRFHALGVGYDVDARLLDDLAHEGGGSVSYVRPGEDVAEAVTTLWRRVEHPCARNVELTIRGAHVTEIFPEEPRDLYAGEPLLFAGRVKPGAGRATVQLRAEGANGEGLRESWRIDFDDSDNRSRSVPVLWASRKAAHLLDRIRREGHDPKALAELRALSERYGILNEEVALLAREDEAVLADSRPNPTPSGHRGIFQRFSVDNRTQAPAPLAAEEQFRISKRVWDLKEAGSLASIEERANGEVGMVVVGGVAFRLDGETWIDTRIERESNGRTETVTIRPFGRAYFEMAALSEKLAEWLAVGEKIRILLPGMILEVDPNGSDDLPAATMRRVYQAADQA